MTVRTNKVETTGPWTSLASQLILGKFQASEEKGVGVTGAREMVRQLRVFAGLPEDPSSASSTYDRQLTNNSISSSWVSNAHLWPL